MFIESDGAKRPCGRGPEGAGTAMDPPAFMDPVASIGSGDRVYNGDIGDRVGRAGKPIVGGGGRRVVDIEPC
jgi:hypothetical protein